jgi:hypothetical protein
MRRGLLRGCIARIRGIRLMFSQLGYQIIYCEEFNGSNGGCLCTVPAVLRKGCLV